MCTDWLKKIESQSLQLLFIEQYMNSSRRLTNACKKKKKKEKRKRQTPNAQSKPTPSLPYKVFWLLNNSSESTWQLSKICFVVGGD